MDYEQIRRLIARSDVRGYVADAFRKALGIPPKGSEPASRVRTDKYGDVRECFENRRRVRL